MDSMTKNYAFRVGTDESNRAVFSVKLKNGTKTFTPEDIGSFILRKLKRMAQDEIGRDISMAVISVPAGTTPEAHCFVYHETFVLQISSPTIFAPFVFCPLSN